MASLFSGPNAINPWIETTVCETVLEKSTTTQRRQTGAPPKLVQVVSIGPRCIRISDGKFTIVAASQQHQDRNYSRGSAVRITDWAVTCANWLCETSSSFTPTDFFWENGVSSSRFYDPYICLYVGKIEPVGGHGMPIFNDPHDIHRSIDVRQALESFPLHSLLPSLHVRMAFVMSDDVVENNQNNNVDTEAAAARQNEENGAKDPLPMGDLAGLVATNKGILSQLSRALRKESTTAGGGLCVYELDGRDLIRVVTDPGDMKSLFAGLSRLRSDETPPAETANDDNHEKEVAADAMDDRTAIETMEFTQESVAYDPADHPSSKFGIGRMLDSSSDEEDDDENNNKVDEGDDAATAEKGTGTRIEQQTSDKQPVAGVSGGVPADQPLRRASVATVTLQDGAKEASAGQPEVAAVERRLSSQSGIQESPSTMQRPPATESGTPDRTQPPIRRGSAPRGQQSGTASTETPAATAKGGADSLPPLETQPLIAAESASAAPVEDTERKSAARQDSATAPVEGSSSLDDDDNGSQEQGNPATEGTPEVASGISSPHGDDRDETIDHAPSLQRARDLQSTCNHSQQQETATTNRAGVEAEETNSLETPSPPPAPQDSDGRAAEPSATRRPHPPAEAPPPPLPGDLAVPRGKTMQQLTSTMRQALHTMDGGRSAEPLATRRPHPPAEGPPGDLAVPRREKTMQQLELLAAKRPAGQRLIPTAANEHGERNMIVRRPSRWSKWLGLTKQSKKRPSAAAPNALRSKRRQFGGDRIRELLLNQTTH